MSESYYKPCGELDICNELIEKYFNTQQYEKCFEGHLPLAEQGYPLAECQVGYFYYDGLGVKKDLPKAVWWTRRAADHGDRDGQYNLAWFYEDAIDVERDLEQAAFWYRKAALQDHDLAIEKCKELGISLDDEIIDKEGIRRELKCRVFPLNYLPSYKYTVICSNYQGKWILSKHKKRDTWETQGGHIEDGETPLEAAKRELFEESGIRDADVYPVCDYWGFNPFRCSNGMVFLAVVHSIGELPESEMKEIGMFEELPVNLTYPQTSPVLYREAEKLLESLIQQEHMRNTMSIKTIIVDLDRTLLRTDKTISSYTAAVLKECKKNAIGIMVATARPLRAIKQYCEMIDFDAMVVSNGARVIWGNQRREYGICEKSAERLLKFLQQYPDLRITLETGDCAYSNKPIEDYETVICDDLIGLAKTEGALKILVHIDNEETLAIVKNELTEDLYCTIANGYLMQIMSKSATKWNGIKAMLDIGKCSSGEAAYFGDDYDDIEPIKMCGMGVAVANGIDEVKAVADYVAESNDADGVAKFLDQWLLNKL